MRTAAAAAKSRKPAPASQLKAATSFPAPRLDARSASIQAKQRRRGNPTWGKPAPSEGLPVQLSTFERLAAEHHISPERWAGSHILREFARKNANRLYVPEELLLHWGIGVHDAELSATIVEERILRRNAQYVAAKRRAKERLGNPQEASA